MNALSVWLDKKFTIQRVYFIILLFENKYNHD